MGVFAKTLEVLKNPQGADCTWVGAQVQTYASAFLSSCQANFQGIRSQSSKRKLPISEIVTVAKKKRGCSACGESFATGHHTKANCPNIRIENKPQIHEL